jgi:sugar phosphate isomerase/epimerase
VTDSFVSDPHLVLAWGTVHYASFPDRVLAAAEAGFPSIGLSVGEYRALLVEGWLDHQIRTVLAEHDVAIDEVEVLMGIGSEPGPANLPERPGLIYADPLVEQTALHIATTFGARRIQAVGEFSSRVAGGETVAAFAALCDRVAVSNIQIALEFVPYSNIADVAIAADIIERAQRDNGGICVDAWHFFRGSRDFETLKALDPSRVFMIQVNDGPAVPVDENRMRDAVHHRLCPGEGEFDLERFLEALDRTGMHSAVSVEIYSDQLNQLPTMAAASRAANSTRELFARYRVSSASRGS